MDDELESLLTEEEKETQVPASGEPPKEEPKEPETKKEDEEALKKQQHLANLTKAISEATTELNRIRDEKRKVKLTPEQLEEEDVPKIDMDDPSAKAWNRHINQRIDPVQKELEKEKEEIRSFALQEFMADKPALAKNSDKVKELVSVYERIRTATERTKEGVLLDLRRAYAAVFHEELLQAARQERINQAKTDTFFSDIAVSKGATAYQNKTEPRAHEPKTEEEREIAHQWDKSLSGLGYK
jgi:DNA-directed RNA polymerase subunit H (RpoH/RPB5)